LTGRLDREFIVVGGVWSNGCVLVDGVAVAPDEGAQNFDDGGLIPVAG
jgi:hypothetical protein